MDVTSQQVNASWGQLRGTHSALSASHMGRSNTRATIVSANSRSISEWLLSHTGRSERIMAILRDRVCSKAK